MTNISTTLIASMAADTNRPAGTLANWTISTQEEISLDWHKYSKAWHRSYGPAKSIDARYVRFENGVETKTVYVNSWRGNYLLDALIEAGICEAYKGLKHVRLHSAYAVIELRRGQMVKIYERTLVGEHVDYCAVLGSTAFHAETIKAAMQGLRRKLRKQALRAAGKLITIETGRALGFCEAGMKAFAQTFDLDLRGSYSPDEIAHRVKSNIVAARPFAAELRTLATAVGYEVQI